jgi:hypothetical protein
MENIYVRPVFEASNSTTVYFSSVEGEIADAVVNGVVSGVVGGVVGGIVGGIVADAFPGPAVPG